jgi:hypothetical protein
MNAPEPPGSPRRKASHPEAPAKPIDYDRLAEQRITEAQKAGEFDNLPGFGQPLPGIDEPHDELWWVKEKLKREKVSALPPALEIRRDVEQTLAAVSGLVSEEVVRRELTALNERIRKAHYAAVWGPPSTTMPVDIEVEITRWRAARSRR